MFGKALLAFLALPGLFGILLPVTLGILDPWRNIGSSLGAILVWIGGSILVWCVRDFYVFGKGTLAPWEPPKNLVIVGLYRHTRNPMYIGVLFMVCGFTILFGSPLLLGYFILVAIGFHIRIILKEEPWLLTQFGDEFLGYKNGVSRWLPRITPWRNK